MKERRTYQRVETEMPARYAFIEGDEPLHFEATVVNISPVGVCFNTEEEVEKGKRGKLHISPGTADEAILDIEVVWSKKLPDQEMHSVGVKVADGETFLKQ